MSKKEKTPKKDFADQFDDEEVLFVFRKHPVVMRKGLIISMIAILAGTIPALIKPELSYFYGGLAVGLVLAVIVFIPSWIIWFYSVFIVTNQRLIQITQKGFFNKSVVDIGLKKIQSTNYEIKGIQATLLGFGTIMIQTYMGDLVVHEVHKPAEVIRKLNEVLRGEGIEPEEMDEAELEEKGNEEAFEEI
ncbi:PH domain-containing protein [Candidatus Saccharibacteria bacterium]|nr:PH domain-containing protein [Candidatus Saccharibacteria bacterium]